MAGHLSFWIGGFLVSLFFLAILGLSINKRLFGQFDALVSFTFNLGSGAFQRSTLRRKVNRQAHAEVPAQLMRWVWAGGRMLEGLKKRRSNEAKVYCLI